MERKVKTLKVKNRNLGVVSVKVDAEDSHLFTDFKVTVTDIGSNNGPMIRFHDGNEHPYASRVILEKHGMLDSEKNVMYKNNKHYDLRKSNLIQA